MDSDRKGTKGYDTTVARVAGNLMSNPGFGSDSDAVVRAVMIARQVVAEVKRTEPDQETLGGGVG